MFEHNGLTIIFIILAKNERGESDVEVDGGAGTFFAS